MGCVVSLCGGGRVSGSYGEGFSPNGKFSYGYASTIGYRKKMEDYFETRVFETVDECLVGFFAVYDGHAGHRAAEYLKGNLFRNIATHPNFFDDTQTALVEAYRKTDTNLLASPIDKGGSTATTAILFENKLVVGNVGDSRMVICRADKNGTKVRAMTRDHKPYLHDERARIEAAGGTVVGTRINGLAISRAFGDRQLKKFVTVDPETKEIELDSTLKWLIIASDGLWDVVSNERAEEIVRKEKDARSAAAMLMSEALSQVSLDNITCVVVLFHNE